MEQLIWQLNKLVKHTKQSHINYKRKKKSNHKDQDLLNNQINQINLVVEQEDQEINKFKYKEKMKNIDNNIKKDCQRINKKN